ncbi:SART-1 family protein [Babesia ovis]|uniref:SART-1 family protein n=1 Tax=Babesia ovis TaxID=5869 RepID=A0A9W5T9A3_BABOV|nr:SART-1 family protein [Babesia ovis]
MEYSGGDGVVSCSIEETNALRRKLGLKPLAVGDSGSGNTGSSVDAPNNLHTADQKTDESVEARKRLIEGDGVADLLARGKGLSPSGGIGDSNEDDGGYSTLDINAWSRRMSNLHGRNRVGVLNYSDDEDETEVVPKTISKPAPKVTPKLKVLHKVDELPLESGKEVILTLADVGVLEAEAAGVAEVNFLEQPDMAKRKPNKGHLQGGAPGEYNPYEDEEEKDDLGVGGKRDILQKYDEAVEEYQGAKLVNLASKKRGFYLNLDEVNEPEKKKVHTMLTQPTEESFDFGGLQRKKNLLKKRDKPVNWNRLFGSTISNAVGNSVDEGNTNADDDAPSSQIIKRATLDMDDVEECNQLYKQLAKHRSRVLATVKEEPPAIPSSSVRTSLIDTGSLQTESSGLHLNATLELINAVKPTHDTEEKTTSQPRVNAKVTTAAENTAVSDHESDEVEYPDGGLDNDAPMTMGIAGALAYLKDKGDLIEKKKDLDGVGKDINLQYFDEYGRRMTPKEAFRQLSWRFHGKGPGLNKRERTIKRIERERQSKQNPLEGLPTMKALLTHQAESKSSHLVLSGNNNGS